MLCFTGFFLCFSFLIADHLRAFIRLCTSKSSRRLYDSPHFPDLNDHRTHFIQNLSLDSCYGSVTLENTLLGCQNTGWDILLHFKLDCLFCLYQNQDHYAVLGLGHVRYKATQRQIKAARKYLVILK